MKSAWWELEDIVFTEVDTRWVHHPHSDALVITTWIINNNVHKILVDNGSAIDIIYLDAYKGMGLNKCDSSPTTTPLYRFTGDHVIPKGMIKLAVTIGEHPWVSTIVTEFLIVDCPSTFNGVIGRLLLKALKVVTSIYSPHYEVPNCRGNWTS